MLRRSLISISAGLLAACSSIRQETRTNTVHLESTPPGAVITVVDERGKRSLGAAPATAEIEYVTEYVDFNPWSVLTPLISCGGTAGLIGLGASSDSGAVTGLSIGGAVSVGLICLFGTINVISTAAMDGDPSGSFYKNGPPTFAAMLAGHSDASHALSANDPFPTAPLRFELHATGGGGGTGAIAALAPPERSVVAVFEVVTADSRIGPSVLDQLTDYLATKIAETGRYRVVPRDQLRRHLSEQKKQSYNECMDTSCQIELGKAVAANLSLATKVLHVGSECALSATLYDLKLEATASGASLRTPCDADHLMDGVDQLVEKLTR